jgi:hypothetical protein
LETFWKFWIESVIFPLLRVGEWIYLHTMQFGWFTAEIVLVAFWYVFWRLEQIQRFPLWLRLPAGMLGGGVTGTLGLHIARFAFDLHFFPDTDDSSGSYGIAIWIGTIPVGMVLGASTGVMLALRRRSRVAGWVGIVMGIVTIFPALLWCKGMNDVFGASIALFPVPWSVFLSAWGLRLLQSPNRSLLS